MLAHKALIGTLTMGMPLFWADRPTPAGYSRVGWLNVATPDHAEAQLKVGHSEVYVLHAEHGQAVAEEKGKPLALDTRYPIASMSVARGVSLVARWAKDLRSRVKETGKEVGYYCQLVLLADDDLATYARAVEVQDTGGEGGGSLFQLFDFVVIDAHPHPANSFAAWCRQLEHAVTVAKARKVKKIRVVIADHWCSGALNGVWLPAEEARLRFEYAKAKVGVENVIRWSARKDACPIDSVIDKALGVKA